MIRTLTFMIALGLVSTTMANEAHKAAKAKSATMKVKEINKNPAAWVNKTVTLKGEVEKIDNMAFVLDGDGIFNDQILVIDESKFNKKTAEPVTVAFAEDDEVIVNGKIRQLTLTQIRRDYAIDLDSELALDYDGIMPVLVTKFTDVSKVRLAE